MSSTAISRNTPSTFLRLRSLTRKEKCPLRISPRAFSILPERTTNFEYFQQLLPTTASSIANAATILPAAQTTSSAPSSHRFQLGNVANAARCTFSHLMYENSQRVFDDRNVNSQRIHEASQLGVCGLIICKTCSNRQKTTCWSRVR